MKMDHYIALLNASILYDVCVINIIMCEQYKYLFQQNVYVFSD